MADQHPAAPFFATSQTWEGTDLLSPTFAAMVMTRGLLFGFQVSWSTEAEPDRAVFEDEDIVAEFSGESFLGLILDRAGVVAMVRWFSNDRVHLVVSGRSRADCDAAIEWAKGLLPEVDDEEDEGTIPVRFWTQGIGGPTSVTRRISAPTLDDIRSNYNEDVVRDLDHIMSERFEPGKGGQLLLWYGPPGTGKTYALRALAQSWRKWCRIDYVVDPERFFGDSAYLMPVLLSSSGDEERPWRLLIFEDTGELLSENAAARAGQGLSRLLNVVDGFIGQGLRTLILITTNEQLDKLHPAVSRPGRCAVKTNFDTLTAERAQAWGKHNGVLVPKRPHALAELFAVRDDTRRDAPEQAKTIGFRLPSDERSA